MDKLAKLHWEAIIAQKIDSTSEHARQAVEEFNRELDRQLISLVDSMREVVREANEANDQATKS